MPRGTDGPRGLKSLGGTGVPLTSIVYGPPFGRNIYTTNALSMFEIILPQTNRYRVSDSTFSFFFARPMGRVVLVAVVVVADWVMQRFTPTCSQ